MKLERKLLNIVVSHHLIILRHKLLHLSRLMHSIKKRSSYSIIAAWCLYDWAAASFSIIVTTFIFSTYFTTKIAANPISGTYQWANATSLAGLIIAFTGPVFGAVADYG